MTKLRILQVLPAFGTGGVEEGTLAVSQALIDAGHSSFITSAGGQKVGAAEAHGAKHITLPLDSKSPMIILPLISELSNIIREHNIDIVHARSRWPAWLARMAAQRCGVHFMTTFHGYHKANNPVKSWYNSVMVRAPHTIAVSNFMYDYITKTYARTLNKYGTHLHTIPRGIDHVRFDPTRVTEKDLEDLRRQWGVPSSTKLILLPARMTRMKGHEVLINALPHIQLDNWRAILVGGQDHRMDYQNHLEKRIQELGLSDKVKIVPAIHNMEAAYKLADVIVHPAIQPEAFGRVIIETQAMGKPIITSNIGEPATLVNHGINGWQFESGNSRDLALQLDHVLSLGQKELDQLAKTARKSVLDNYTKELMCQRTLDVYKQVCRQSEFSHLVVGGQTR